MPKPRLPGDANIQLRRLTQSQECNSASIATREMADGSETVSVKTKRPQVFRACPACRKVKARCADTRPCPRCVRLDRVETCATDDALLPRKRRKERQTATTPSSSAVSGPLQSKAIKAPGPAQNPWSLTIPNDVPALGGNLDAPKMESGAKGNEVLFF